VAPVVVAVRSQHRALARVAPPPQVKATTAAMVAQTPPLSAQWVAAAALEGLEGLAPPVTYLATAAQA
jgi:hypothetical protein